MEENPERQEEYLIRLVMGVVCFALGAYFCLKSEDNNYKFVIGIELMVSGYFMVKNKFEGFNITKN